MRAVHAATLLALLLLAGCALPPRADIAHAGEPPLWRGRLAVRVESDPPQSPSQSFSAGFELTGTPLAGELTLYTPLGSTAAALSWSAQTAVMRGNGDVRHFTSLDALIKEAVGTEIPVAALFSWLAGEAVSVAGWRADLSQHAEGRITARRIEPTPMAELRLVLEK